MAYYHCSPTAGLKLLYPQKPAAFDKPARVYLTTLLPMALMYSVRNYEYTYGYDESGQISFTEYFPNALEILYRGQKASLYLCAPGHTEQTEIPHEAVCESPVPIIQETLIPDAYEALLEQERDGALLIHRFEALSPAMLAWIKEVQKDEILQNDLLHTPGPKADYYRTHYPESWNAAIEGSRK